LGTMTVPIPHRFAITKVRIVGEWSWDQKCVICLGDIKPGEKILMCPKCGAIGHEDHFLEWIKVKALCPNCRSILREKDLKRF